MGIEGISNVPWNRLAYGARVSIINLGDNEGDEEFTGEFGKYGDREGEFIWPSGMVLAPNGHIYVADEWMNMVSEFEKDGTFIKRWSAVPADDGKEHGTSSLAVDADGNLYLTDGRSHEVRKFTADGEFITSWGSLGEGNGEFNSPWGITVDQSDGSVYVADHRNHRVQKFTADGEWLMQFGEAGTKRGQMHLPVQVTVDHTGDVYVADWSDNGMHPGRVHVFDKEGSFIISLIGDAQWLSKWADMTVVANADYLKRRREVPTTESEWRFRLSHRCALRREHRPSGGAGCPAQPAPDLQQDGKLHGSPDEPVMIRDYPGAGTRVRSAGGGISRHALPGGAA